MMMTGLRGSSSSRCEPVAESVSTVASSASRSAPALITRSEHVGDDWLIEDVRGGLKRKRPDVDSLFKDVNIRTAEKKHRQRPASGQTSGQSRLRDVERRTLVDREDHSLAGRNFDGDRASPESTMMLSDEMMETEPRELPAFTAALQRRKQQTRLSKSGSIVPAVAGRPGSTTARNKAESTGQSVTSTTATKPPSTPQPNPLKMRLKVRIGDQLILVPILERFADCVCREYVKCELF